MGRLLSATPRGIVSIASSSMPSLALKRMGRRSAIFVGSIHGSTVNNLLTL